jgi:hypothetical protein
MLGAAYHARLTRRDLLDGPLHDWIIERLVDSQGDIDSEVVNQYIHLGLDDKGNHDAVWGFITSFGKRFGSNFGLMFDPTTGKKFADDDPRRR